MIVSWMFLKWFSITIMRFWKKVLKEYLILETYITAVDQALANTWQMRVIHLLYSMTTSSCNNERAICVHVRFLNGDQASTLSGENIAYIELSKVRFIFNKDWLDSGFPSSVQRAKKGTHTQCYPPTEEDISSVERIAMHQYKQPEHGPNNTIEKVLYFKFSSLRTFNFGNERDEDASIYLR